MLPAYYCEKCELAVIMLPQHKPIKACKCAAPIIANCSGTVTSHSLMKQAAPVGPAVQVP